MHGLLGMELGIDNDCAQSNTLHLIHKYKLDNSFRFYNPPMQITVFILQVNFTPQCSFIFALEFIFVMLQVE